MIELNIECSNKCKPVSTPCVEFSGKKQQYEIWISTSFIGIKLFAVGLTETGAYIEFHSYHKEDEIWGCSESCSLAFNKCLISGTTTYPLNKAFVFNTVEKVEDNVCLQATYCQAAPRSLKARIGVNQIVECGIFGALLAGICFQCGQSRVYAMNILEYVLSFDKDGRDGILFALLGLIIVT